MFRLPYLMFNNLELECENTATFKSFVPPRFVARYTQECIICNQGKRIVTIMKFGGGVARKTTGSILLPSNRTQGGPSTSLFEKRVLVVDDEPAASACTGS